MTEKKGIPSELALEELWRSRLQQIAGTIAANQRDHEEIANLAQHVGHDYHGRFLIELLQNAHDPAVRAGMDGGSSGMGEGGLIVVVRTHDMIAVLNEGTPIDEAGLNSITSLGISTKDASKHVGNKGIGFKSVYEVTATPILLSNPRGDGLATIDAQDLRVKLALAGC